MDLMNLAAEKAASNPENSWIVLILVAVVGVPLAFLYMRSRNNRS